MESKDLFFRTGIDAGSTTLKIAVLDESGKVVFSSYLRHNTDIKGTLLTVLDNMKKKIGDVVTKVCVTGSAGIGISERVGLKFIQEVVASAEAVSGLFGKIGTLLDIGGEDSKMIIFDANGNADIRMNGNCAGGTGAFIDQMASLMSVPVEELSDLAAAHTKIYPVASRCGVFAKTDVQNLLSREIPKGDIAASIFNAVVTQVMNTLARGSSIKPPLLFSGGPLAFIPFLRDLFLKRIGLTESDAVIPEKPELFPAMGSAYYAKDNELSMTVSELISLISSSKENKTAGGGRLNPLFESEEYFRKWYENRYMKVTRAVPELSENSDCFLGIDAGSTTTKIVAINRDGEIMADYYRGNGGDHIVSVRSGLAEIQKKLASEGIRYHVKAVAVTGYGEDLVKAVFSADFGIVETLAHLKAAQKISNGNVDFILDIGGQDMKAMFVENGHVLNIEINEACSSGCGSFIQTFALSLGLSVEEFADKGCLSKAPCDLGSRCTVFMNSKVKQALKEGAGIEDISAGLAFSVVRNSLYKVLKLKDMDEIGQNVILQGGTFKNPCVQRAFEIITGKKVIVPDIAGVMGAYGAALKSLEKWNENKDMVSEFIGFLSCTEESAPKMKKTLITCKGCENTCSVTKMDMGNGKIFYAGNNCEKIFSSGGGTAGIQGFDAVSWKRHLLFERESCSESEALMKVGIPRALNIYENYPFWHALFTKCGIRLVLSDPSTVQLYESGSGSVMSDSICFPAKLMHGHIFNLINKKVDRIFYPMVVYEDKSGCQQNSFNCPIVSGYPDVIKSSINPENNYGIPLDTPAVSFKDKDLLEKKLKSYFTKTFGVSHYRFRKAFAEAMKEKDNFKVILRQKSDEIITKAKQEGRKVVMLIGRPYHIDPLINHKIPEMITVFGFDVITEDSVSQTCGTAVKVLDQWEYSNRLYSAAWYAAGNDTIIPVQLNSFGCGPDSIATDEMKEILKSSGKNLTTIRIDEIASPGSTKLRLRTLFESMDKGGERTKFQRKELPVLKEEDMKKQILVPFFADFYSPFVEHGLRSAGINVVSLPKPDAESLKEGLRYANNEICYPAIIIVGDIIRALKSGKYDLKNTVVGITQTGGQCRASNYFSMIRKAMIAAGFDTVPVVSFSTTNRAVTKQPKFRFRKIPFINWGLKAILLADAVSRMYYAVAAREKTKGSALKLANSLIAEWNRTSFDVSRKEMFRFLRKAVDGFNGIEIDHDPRPKIGVVGEIYVKYSSFANHDVLEWLINHGIEPVMPDLVDFFVQEIINVKINSRENLSRNDMFSLFLPLLEKHFTKFHEEVGNEMKRFKFSYPYYGVRDLAGKASKILSLVNQFGEGWLIAAEIASFAENGINDVLCLQPFGCIANQVVAKGVEKKMKDIYPGLDILFIDLDSDTSPANMMNRVHFLVRNAKNHKIRRSHE
ncbi:MAG TPA: acyl-CoA dehydratase activase-related protein [bacterium]|nr:acyl-CoA dehydratase activase-related protein [bacterium]HQN72398.1 acyl-CoA dehydratase activase-related protein [bacterium]